MNGDYERGFRGNQTAPVNVGDELEVKIEAVGEKGDGIAKKNGFVLFVPNTNEGDEVKIRVTKVLRKVGFAEVIGKSEGKSEKSEEPEEGESQSESQPEAESEEEPEDSEDFGDEEAKD
ncbi:MAG TPA: TRAM domain-containing protein [Candidatus Nanoarchaeia archaeon]|nr:TRAM domain-containing protein [Candidatus Nanoarchaeia archaeon]